MPLTASYTWNESLSEVNIILPLKGISKSKVDIYVSDVFIKVNFPPYLGLIDLAHAVYDDKVIARFEGGSLHLICPKMKSSMWGDLCLKADRAVLNRRRHDATEAKTAKDIEKKILISENKHSMEKKALRKQMSLEEEERNRLENLKAQEKADAEEEVYRALSEVRSSINTSQKVYSTHYNTAVESKENHSPPTSTNTTIPSPGIILPAGNLIPKAITTATSTTKTNSSTTSAASMWNRNEVLSDEDDDVLVEGVSIEEEEETGDDIIEEELVYIPPPRSTTKLTFKHTPRVFKTPLRESKRADEEDWVAKNGSHLRRQREISGGDARDIEERDPVWLKGKADDFFKRKDYRGAVNAYTAAVETDNYFLAAKANRAASFLKLHEHQRCIEDCNDILSDMNTELTYKHHSSQPMDANKIFSLKLRSLLRRGAAFCQQGDYESAKIDYLQAQKLDMDNRTISADIDRLEKLVHSSVKKKDGDSLFRKGEISGAIDMYTIALEVDPCYVSAISNRAACYLQIKQYDNAILDCSLALELLNPLSTAVGKSSETLPNVITSSKLEFIQNKIPSGPIPAPSSVEFKAWLIKTLVRRGSAYVKLENYKEAKNDYSIAFNIDPKNKEIAIDLARIRDRLKALGQL